MRAWAVCDTDGGRQDPQPLVIYVRATKGDAEGAQKYQGFDPAYYPVLEIEITVTPEAPEKP